MRQSSSVGLHCTTATHPSRLNESQAIIVGEKSMHGFEIQPLKKFKGPHSGISRGDATGPPPRKL